MVAGEVAQQQGEHLPPGRLGARAAAVAVGVVLGEQPLAQAHLAGRGGPR